MPLLVEHVTHIFSSGLPSEATAVHDVSLEIADGEWLGIIGHTGSGKSTLIQHFNGLLQPSAGRVVVNGIDLADKKTRKAVRKQVGMVFQYPEYQLFEETVEKDIAFGPKNMGISDPNQLQACVRHAMEQVGLSYEEIAGQSPFDLSGGQKRRVALAGILAMQPSILVLDEPMAGLDPRGRKEILQYLKNFHQNGMTIVMVSHSMDDIAELTDRVLVMNAGKSMMIGTPAEVFSQWETLSSIGLDVPQATRVAHALRERGFSVPQNIYRLEELAQWIIAQKGGSAVE